jgi:hypothetical protein
MNDRSCSRPERVRPDRWGVSFVRTLLVGGGKSKLSMRHLL